MPREFRQDANGYNVAIRYFEREYKRALGNETRSKGDYQGVLDRIQWLLDLYRCEQRELVTKGRGTPGVPAFRARRVEAAKKPAPSRTLRQKAATRSRAA